MVSSNKPYTKTETDLIIEFSNRIFIDKWRLPEHWMHHVSQILHGNFRYTKGGCEYYIALTINNGHLLLTFSKQDLEGHPKNTKTPGITIKCTEQDGGELLDLMTVRESIIGNSSPEQKEILEASSVLLWKRSEIEFLSRKRVNLEREYAESNVFTRFLISLGARVLQKPSIPEELDGLQHEIDVLEVEAGELKQDLLSKIKRLAV